MFKAFYSVKQKKKRKILFSLFIVNMSVGKMSVVTEKIVIAKSKNGN